MIRWLAILFFCFAALRGLATDYTLVTNNMVVAPLGDSFQTSGAGQRNNLILGSYFINRNPQFVISFRDMSRSGANNFDFVTDQLTKYGIPYALATHGTTNMLTIVYCSGNGGFNSNLVYTNVVTTLQFPTNAFNKNLLFTNDWTQPNAAQLFKFWVVGDPPYWASDARATYSYSGGGRVAAVAAGVPYIDSWQNLSGAVTNFNGGYPANSNLFFPPANDHFQNAIALDWALTTLTNAGADSNIFSTVIDFNAATVRATNHCTVGSVSLSGLTLTVSNFRADCMGPSFYVPDGTTTNDCRGAFDLMPSMGNAFYELLQVTNLPAGNYRITWEDGSSFVTTSSQLASGLNWFTNYSTPFWNQKMSVLYALNDLMDVLHTDNASAAHTPTRQLLPYFQSGASTVWTTNAVGVDGFYTQLQSVYSAFNPLFAQDAIIHTAAQQTNHTFSVTLITQRYAPFHR